MFAVGASFVRTDLDLLEKHFDVTPMAWDPEDRLFGLRVAKHLRTHDAAFIWFCDTHAHLAAKWGSHLRRPVVVVPGQYELADYPEGPYGLKYEDGRRWRNARIAVRRARLVLAVSQYHADLIRPERGDRDTRIVYHGFDASQVEGGADTHRERLVVTIAHAANRTRVWHKGLDTFARAAALVKDARFMLIGDVAPEIATQLNHLAQGNLHLTGGLQTPEVLDTLRRARVYAQLSGTETFGCAVAEAMLCGCAPVLTRRGSLPEVGGDLSLYVDYGDAPAAADAISRALTSTSGELCRKRVEECFPLQAREDGLVAALNSVTSGDSAGRALPGERT